MRLDDFIIINICIHLAIIGVFSSFVTLQIIFLIVHIAFIIVQKRFKDVDVKPPFVEGLVLILFSQSYILGKSH